MTEESTGLKFSATEDGETIRAYLDLHTMQQVRAALSLAEALGLPIRMAPMAKERRRSYGTENPDGSALTIDKHASYALGGKVNGMKVGGHFEKLYPATEKILRKGPMRYPELQAKLVKASGVTKLRAGLALSYMLRTGALVKHEQ